MVEALNIAVRKAAPPEPAQPVAVEAAPGPQTISFVTRVEQVWEKPRGKFALVGGTVIVLAVLGLLLSQLPGRVQIAAPGPALSTAEGATATSGVAQAATPTSMVTQATTPTSARPTVTAVPPSPTATAIQPAAEIAALKWEKIANGKDFMQAVVNTIAVDPTDPNTVFVGMYGAGIYVSRDGGQTWAPSGDGLNKGTLGRIAIDPTAPNIVYAAMYDQGGVYKSTDGGRTWTAANLGLDLDYVGGWSGFVAIAPSDHNKLYYATGHADGFGISNDGGASWVWQAVNCPAVTKLAIDSVDAKHLYANNNAPSGSDCLPGVYETRDGGLTWTRLASPEMASDWWQQVAVDPRDFKIIYATGGQAGLFKSTDGGATWKKIQARGCWWLDTNPGDGTLYCGQESVMLSRDGGATWVRTDLGPSAGRNDGHPFAVAPGDPRTLYWGSSIIMKSTDDGQTVSSLGSLGMVRMDIGVDPRDGQRLFLGGTLAEVHDSPCFTYRSTDAGRTWQVIVNSDGNCLVVTGPASPDLFRISDQSNGYLRSTDNGDNWQPGGGVSNIGHILPDPVDAKKLWIGGGNTISASEDGGKTFAAVHEIASYSGLQVMLIDPTGRRVYALTDREFHRSDDGGATWKTLNGPGGGYRAAIIDPTNPDVVYTGSTHKGVLKTTDGGESWRQINTGLSNNLGVNDLALDPRNPQTVYAATDAGAFVTLDGGEQWTRIETGLGPNPVVYSIAIDPNDSSKVYAVTPDGVYRLAGAPTPTQCRIVFVGYEENYNVHVRNCDGSGVQQVTDLVTEVSAPEHPVWSPDGQAILFVSRHKGNKSLNSTGEPCTSLYVIRPDGTGLARWTRDRCDNNPAWSPDGARIAFNRSCDLVVMNADGTGVATIARPHAELFCIEQSAWSPDGQRIAFTSLKWPSLGILAEQAVFVVNPDGSDLTQLAAVPAEDRVNYSVVWSPAGDQIAFRFAQDGLEQNYSVNSDGSGEPTRIIEIPESWYPWYWPQWDKAQAVPITMAEQARAFAEPILAAIADRKPDFADDFSTADKGWSASGDQKEGFAIQDGVARLRVSEGSTFFSNNALSRRDFVLQFDARQVEGDLSSMWQARFHGPYRVEVTSKDRKLVVDYDVPDGHSLFDSSNVPAISPLGEATRVTIVARGTRCAIYLNDTPVVYFEEPDFYTASGTLFFCDSNSPAVCEFDNVKLWNLDNVPGLP
jgi:Tol biopolymer transport system component